MTINNETKTNITITNQNKDQGTTWASSAPRTWGDPGTWADPGIKMTNDSKTNITITNENKS